MKLAILVTVAFMAAYLTVTNATSFSAPHRPLGKGRFPRPLSSRAQLQDTSTTCSVEIYKVCSAELDTCADNCASVDSQACSTCLGSNYAECKACYNEKDELDALGLGDFLPQRVMSQGDTAIVQGCSFWQWLSCAGAAVCITLCATGVGAAACVTCLSGLSATCVACVLEEVVEEQVYMRDGSRY